MFFPRTKYYLLVEMYIRWGTIPDASSQSRAVPSQPLSLAYHKIEINGMLTEFMTKYSSYIIVKKELYVTSTDICDIKQSLPRRLFERDKINIYQTDDYTFH